MNEPVVIHIHNEQTSPEVLGLLRQIARHLNVIETKEKAIMLDLTGLQQSVANVDTVAESAVTLIKEIAAEIAANAGDQNAVSQLAADLTAHAEALSQAIVENTPSAPPADTPPDPTAGGIATAHNASTKNS